MDGCDVIIVSTCQKLKGKKTQKSKFCQMMDRFLRLQYKQNK